MHTNFDTNYSVEATCLTPTRSWPAMMGLTTLAEYLDMSTNSVKKLVAIKELPQPVLDLSPRLRRWSKIQIDEHITSPAQAQQLAPRMEDIIKLNATKRGE